MNVNIYTTWKDCRALTPASPPKRSRAKKVNTGISTVKIASLNSIYTFNAIDKACHITQSRNSPSKQNGTISRDRPFPANLSDGSRTSCAARSGPGRCD
jgi:hypothetical protein